MCMCTRETHSHQQHRERKYKIPGPSVRYIETSAQKWSDGKVLWRPNNTFRDQMGENSREMKKRQKCAKKHKSRWERLKRERGVALSIKSSEVIERSGVEGQQKEGQFSAGILWWTLGNLVIPLKDPLLIDHSGRGEGLRQDSAP